MSTPPPLLIGTDEDEAFAHALQTLEYSEDGPSLTAAVERQTIAADSFDADVALALATSLDGGGAFSGEGSEGSEGSDMVPRRLGRPTPRVRGNPEGFAHEAPGTTYAARADGLCLTCGARPVNRSLAGLFNACCRGCAANNDCTCGKPVRRIASSVPLCAICLSEVASSVNSKKLPCAHVFHARCVDRWMEKSRTCPTCRMDIAQPSPPTPPKSSPGGSPPDRKAAAASATAAPQAAGALSPSYDSRPRASV